MRCQGQLLFGSASRTAGRAPNLPTSRGQPKSLLNANFGETQLDSNGSLAVWAIPSAAAALPCTQVVQETYRQLRALGLDSSCWFWPSLTQNAYQTAEVLAALYGVGRNRVGAAFCGLWQQRAPAHLTLPSACM